jgi:hypothetical protein
MHTHIALASSHHLKYNKDARIVSCEDVQAVYKIKKLKCIH